MNAYLVFAEQVLEAAGEPLSAREILQRARVADLVPNHLRGFTQHKTLHARLSEDIARNPEGSPFYRTGPGRFYLKAFLHNPLTPQAYRRIHRAPQRRKELKRDLVLSVEADRLESAADGSGRIEVDVFAELMKSQPRCYHPWREISGSSRYIVVHSFFVVHRARALLSYRKGRFRPDFDLLSRPKSIGFGGVVFASDVDMLFDSFFGLIANGMDDLVHSTGLQARVAERARYQNVALPRLSLLVSEPAGPPRLDVVVSFRCPAEFEPIKTALSTNDLHWMSIDNIPNDVSLYDSTSRRLLEHGWVEELVG